MRYLLLTLAVLVVIGAVVALVHPKSRPYILKLWPLALAAVSALLGGAWAAGRPGRRVPPPPPDDDGRSEDELNERLAEADAADAEFEAERERIEAIEDDAERKRATWRLYQRNRGAAEED